MMLKSVGAVLAGIVAGVGFSLLTDMLMQSLRVFPLFGEPMSDLQCAIATMYRIVYGVMGAYIIARSAPNFPMRHAMVSGVLALLASIAGAVSTWNAMPSISPHWYPIALVVTALPNAWTGAKLFEATTKNFQTPGGRSSYPG